MTTLRQTWREQSRAPLPAAAETGLWGELAAEATRCEPVAVNRHKRRPGLLVMHDGSITSSQRCRVHPGGPAL
ncbi:hypothetical protein ACFV0C_38070 [Streptomyces sp. NPDC059568]|uniref:hypothetical protein n=1 Tax=Streptomyces sp. NPDC059568 TaxID=3346868 RepID=UPI0036958DD2